MIVTCVFGCIVMMYLYLLVWKNENLLYSVYFEDPPRKKNVR